MDMKLDLRLNVLSVITIIFFAVFGFATLIFQFLKII